MFCYFTLKYSLPFPLQQETSSSSSTTLLPAPLERDPASPLWGGLLLRDCSLTLSASQPISYSEEPRSPASPLSNLHSDPDLPGISPLGAHPSQ